MYDRLHLVSPVTASWRSLGVLDQNGREIGYLTDLGEHYVNRYEVRMPNCSFIIAERDIALAMAKAEQAWNNHLANEQADLDDASNLKAALDTISTTVMSIYDEFRMRLGNLEAEKHRNVRRPEDLKLAERRYGEVERIIAEGAGILYRGFRIYHSESPETFPWGASQDFDHATRIVLGFSPNFLGALAMVDDYHRGDRP